MDEPTPAAVAPLRSRTRAAGRVHATQAFPVKSMQARPAAAIELDADGVVGDRRYAVVAGGHVVTAEEAPRLREAVAAVNPDGGLAITVPGGAVAVRGPAADEALTVLIGRAARIVPVAAGATLDAPVHLVSQQALEAASRGEHAAADCACSLEEPRANLVLDVPGSREEQWIGHRLAIGGTVLRVLRRPGHCLGVYAEVERPGIVRPGDPVEDLGAP